MSKRENGVKQPTPAGEWAGCIRCAGGLRELVRVGIDGEDVAVVRQIEGLGGNLKPHTFSQERKLAGDASIGIVHAGTLVAVAAGDLVRHPETCAGGDLCPGDAAIADKRGLYVAGDKARDWKASLRGDRAGDLPTIDRVLCIA